MLTGLTEEIDNWPELTGASKEICMNKLNADGTAMVEAWAQIPISEQKITMSKLALLTYLTPGQRAGIRAMLADTSDQAQDFKMLWEADDSMWVNDNTFRAMLDTIGAALAIDPATITTIKRLGERKISRAEELWSRKLTMEDFE